MRLICVMIPVLSNRISKKDFDGSRWQTAILTVDANAGHDLIARDVSAGLGDVDTAALSAVKLIDCGQRRSAASPAGVSA